MAVDSCHGISADKRQNYVCVYGFFAFKRLMLGKYKSQDMDGEGDTVKMEQELARVMD